MNNIPSDEETGEIVNEVHKPMNQHGRSYREFTAFKERIRKGEKSLMFGPDYVVMSIEHYKDIISNPTKS